jgi:hypothetical protein
MAFRLVDKISSGQVSQRGHRCWVGATSWLRNIKPISDRGPRIGRVCEICLCVHCAPIQWSRRKRPHYKRTVTSATSGAAIRAGTGSSRTPPFWVNRQSSFGKEQVAGFAAPSRRSGAHARFVFRAARLPNASTAAPRAVGLASQRSPNPFMLLMPAGRGNAGSVSGWRICRLLSRFISDAYNNVHNGNHTDCARRHILAS